MAKKKSEIVELLRKNSARIAVVPNNDTRSRSKAWEKFQLIEVDGDVQPFAVCKDCQVVYSYTKRDGTSVLVSHSCGSLRKPERQPSIASFARPQPSSAQLVEAKRKITTKAALCAARDLRPYMFLEGPGMVDLAQTLIDVGATAAERGQRIKAEDVLPSAVTISRDVRKQADEARQCLKDKLQQDMVTCAVTTDGWVDPLRHASYTCVTAHYLDDKMQLQSVVLGTRLMTQAHTAENIFEEVASVLEMMSVGGNSGVQCDNYEFIPDWREREKVAAFVTDNAANMKCAFRDWMEGWTWFGCSCHNLNLVVKHAMEMKELGKDPVLRKLAAQVATAKSLVTLVRRKGIDQHLKKSLKTEVETRWNSMLAMLRSVVEAIEEMTTLPQFQSPDVAELVSGLNATTIKRLVKVLAPLEEATEHLSGQKYACLHLVVPAKEKLKRHLKPAADDDITTKRLKERLDAALEAKFAVNQTHLVAAMLWPPHRRLAQLQTVSEAQRAQAKEELVRMAEKEANGQSDGEASDIDDPAPVGASQPASTRPVAFFSFAAEDAEPRNRTSPASGEREVQDYLEDPGPVGQNIIEDVQRYWSAELTKARFPSLCRVARRLLAVPAASTASERTFSVSGRLLEERRSSLHPDSVDALVFLNSFKKLA